MKRAGEVLIRELTHVARHQQVGLGRFAWRCLTIRGFRPQKEDIEDALSDAYLTAATRIRNEPELNIPNLLGWFRRVLFFTCLKKVDRKHSLGIIDQLDSLEFENSFVRFNPNWENSFSLRNLVNQLDVKERSVLDLVSQGDTTDEIAVKLGYSTDNVRQIKSRAINNLRKVMNKKQ